MNGVVQFLEKIGKFLVKGIKYIFADLKRFAIILLLIILGIISLQYCTTKKDLDLTKAELIESSDTLTTYKNKVGEMYTQTKTYIADISTLKKTNDSLYREVKNLKDHPIVIVKTKTEIRIDTVKIKDNNVIQTYPDTYLTTFNYSEKYCNISGNTEFNLKANSALTSINTISFPATFTTDLIEKKNQLYFITKCDNPYVEINNIEGVMVSPQQSKTLKKAFNKPFVLAAGIGPSITVVDNTVKIYPAIQLTLGYKIIDFKL